MQKSAQKKANKDGESMVRNDHWFSIGHEWGQKAILCFQTLFSQPYDLMVTKLETNTMLNYSILM